MKFAWAFLVVVTSLLAGPSIAGAGDRGLYLALVDTRGSSVEDPRRDAVERTLFTCGDRSLRACRRAHGTSGARNTNQQAIYGVAHGSLDVAVAAAAEHSAEGRRRLFDALLRRGRSLDGVVLYEVAPDGVATLVLVNLNRGRVLRVPLADGAAPLDAAALRAATRFLLLGWSP